MITNINQLIDALGGTVAVARETGRTPGAITQWRTKGVARHARTVMRQVVRRHKLDVAEIAYDRPDVRAAQ